MKLIAADFRAEWNGILPGLQKTLEHQNDGLRWEDVYAALARGSAQLYLADDGFLILRQEQSLDTGRKTLFIWFGYCDGGDAVTRYEPQVLQLACTLGVAEIAFCTIRRGFERTLPESWSRQYVRWHRRVT